MNIYEELQWRGLVADCTDVPELTKRMAAAPITLYCGFDPTADSLHVGHLVPLLALSRFQKFGHHPIAVAGGATGSIGDPSGKSAERSLLTKEQIKANVEAVKPQLARLLAFETKTNPARLVDNADWTAPISYLDFLRDIGKHFSVNQMIAKESVRARMEDREAGISYTEFSYMLLQANDFRHLHDAHGVEMQMGGSDQWGNITAGIDLIRRTSGGAAHGLTWPLLTKSDGSKFGKTADGAVWLDPARTSPYRFRQFWLQTDDADVRDRLLRFSLRSVETIDSLVDQHTAAPHERRAQRELADELTALVHGREAAEAASAAAAVLFGQDPREASAEALDVVGAEIDSSEVSVSDLADVAALMVRVGLASSLGDARRTIDGRGFRCNGEVIEPGASLETADLLPGGRLLLQKGRKSHHLVRVFS